MKTSIKGGPAFARISVELKPEESIIAESDAMSSMDADIDLKAKLNGGFFSGLLKKFFGGESLFINEFKNNTDRNLTVTLVQPCPGDIKSVELNDSTFFLQPGAYIASTKNVKLGLKWAGLVSFIAREGLFKLAVKGNGIVWYGAYGSLLEKNIDGEYIVDTSHLVAYDPSIKLKLQLAGGIFSSFLGGEGLVTRVVGEGRIVVQSRSISGLTGWINPKLY